jgi:hypothetical protein
MQARHSREACWINQIPPTSCLGTRVCSCGRTQPTSEGPGRIEHRKVDGSHIASLSVGVRVASARAERRDPMGQKKWRLSSPAAFPFSRFYSVFGVLSSQRPELFLQLLLRFPIEFLIAPFGHSGLLP